MPFLHPILAFVGLSCVALPILIHILMRRRRRPIVWGAMRFIELALAQQRKRTRLEQLLLLGARCLAVALVTVALARPLLEASSASPRGPRTLYLVIDNGVATSATTGGPGSTSEFDALRTQAEGLLSALDAGRGDRVALVTTASPVETVVLPPSPDVALVTQLVHALKPQDSRTDLVSALAAVRQSLASAPAPGVASLTPRSEVAILSPWRLGSADLKAALQPLSSKPGDEELTLVSTPPVSEPLTNIAITDAAALRPLLLAGSDSDSTTPVRVGLRRSGPGVSQPAVTTVRVSIRALTSTATLPASVPLLVHWEPGQETAWATATVPIPANAGEHAPPLAIVASADADAIAADNTFIRPLTTRDQLRVAIVGTLALTPPRTPDQFTPGDWLGLALAPSASAVDLKRTEIAVTPLDAATLTPAALAGFDAAFVTRPDLVAPEGLRALRALLDASGLVVLAPPPVAASPTWADGFERALGVTLSLAPSPKELSPASTPKPPASADRTLLAPLASELAELCKPVTVSRVLTPQAAELQPLLLLADGSPLLALATPGEARGTVAYLAAAIDLNWTTLPAMPLMVPVTQELLRQGVGRSAGLWTQAAGAPVVPGATDLRPLSVDGLITSTAAARSGTTPVFRSRGLWTATDRAGARLGILSINADPAGSRAEVQARPVIEAALAPLGPKVTWLDGVRSAPTGPGAAEPRPLDNADRTLDLLLLAGALAMVLAETLLSRLFSHARPGDLMPTSALPTGSTPTPAASAQEAA